MGQNPDDLNEPPASSSGADPAKPETFPRSYVEQLRQENAQHRTQNKALAGQLSKLSDSAATIRRLSIDNHLLQKGTGNPTLIRFYLTEEKQLDDLDTATDGWTDVLDDRVDDLLARHPEIRSRNVPTRSSSSGISSGGPGGLASTQITRSELSGMKPEQVEQAMKDGRLNQILGRR
jgi:hypothetical protein